MKIFIKFIGINDTIIIKLNFYQENHTEKQIIIKL